MIEIVNGCDFVMRVRILGSDLSPIPYLELDWTVQYYTYPGVVLEASCKDGVLSHNCNVQDSFIEIYISKFNWGRVGNVRRKISVSFPDSRFLDGSATIITPESITQIKII